MGRIYTGTFSGITVGTAAQDVIQFATSASKRMVLHGFSITSQYQSDERAALQLVRCVTPGSAGTAITANPEDGGNTIASQVTFTRNNTTQGGTRTVLKNWYWSQLGEFLYVPTPALRTVVYESNYLVIGLVAASVAANRLWSGWATWEEL